MPTRENQSPFPPLYHAHNSRDADDLPFWLALAAEQGGPILELGCGTGRVIEPLAQAGHRVYGLDHDAEMLVYLRNQMDERTSQRVGLVQADLCRFRFDLGFSLILLPCNTYTTLDVEQRRQALELVRRHLTPQGVFSTSVPNSAYLRSLPKTAPQEIEEVFPHPVDGEPVQVSSAWRRTSSQFIISWTYDHLLPDGRVDRFTYQVSQNILPVTELVIEFQSAGLQVKKLYGDFDLSPLSEESLYQIVIAAPKIS